MLPADPACMVLLWLTHADQFRDISKVVDIIKEKHNQTEPQA